MGLRRRLLGGGGKLIVGQLLGQACSFGRNIIVARLLTPADFGVAATFAIAASLFEMVSNLAVDRLLVQATDGDDPIFQATAQAFQVLRGLGMALLLFLMAWPISSVFGIPHALWAFQCLALVPLVRGFTHLDSKRFQRQFGFGRDVAIEVIPQMFLLFAAWPFVWWFQDYSAMLWLLVAQAIVMVGVSHYVAQRRYTWAWSTSLLKRMYAFGWPSLLNGLLMFLVLQGDRMIVGSAYGMVELGVYSVAFSVTLIPSMMIAKVASTVFLPLLSKEQTNLRRFSQYYSLLLTGLCLTGIAVAGGFILFGQQVVILAYGAKYSGVSAFLSWLAIMHMLRTIRFAPTTSSVALGDTVTPLFANTVRVALFPAGLAIALMGKPIEWFVIMACVSELAAIGFILARLHRKFSLSATLSTAPLGISLVGISMTYAVASAAKDSSTLISVGAVLTVILAASVMIYWLSPSFRLIRPAR